MTRPLKQCPGCGHDHLSEPWRIPRRPVVLNYRFATGAKAMGMLRRDLRLVQCEHCGLIFNSTLEPDLIPYDKNYENRQCFSQGFQKHSG